MAIVAFPWQIAACTAPLVGFDSESTVHFPAHILEVLLWCVYVFIIFSLYVFVYVGIWFCYGFCMFLYMLEYGFVLVFVFGV